MTYNSPEEYPKGFLQARPNPELQIREFKEFTTRVMANLV